MTNRKSHRLHRFQHMDRRPNPESVVRKLQRGKRLNRRDAATIIAAATTGMALLRRGFDAMTQAAMVATRYINQIDWHVPAADASRRTEVAAESSPPSEP